MAVALAGAGDVVLVLGKGHEQGQEVAGTVTPFDDRVVLAEALAARRSCPPTCRPTRGRHVIALTLGEVADAVGGRLAGGADPATRGHRRHHRLAHASHAGDLFVAVVGEHHDAHDFAAAGRSRRGAVAVLAVARARRARASSSTTPCSPSGASRARSSTGCPTLVVVGDHRLVAARPAPRTCMAQVLVELGPVVAPQGSFNTEVGLPVTALGVDARTRVLVSEMGARGARAHRATSAASRRRASASCSTSGPRTSASSARARTSPRPRASWSRPLPPAADGGVAVLNADDPLVAAMASRTRGAGRHSTAGPRDADVRAEDETLDDDGRAALHASCAAGSRAPVSLQLHGAHQVSNALAVAAAALALGLARRRGRRAGSRRRTAGEPLAHGGVDDRRRRHRGQRRLQRQPRVRCAPRSTRSWPWRGATDAARPRGTWAVLGEMRELGAERGVRARGGRPRRPPSVGIDRRRRGRCGCRRPAWREAREAARRCHRRHGRAGRRRGGRAAARARCRAGRRRPGEGLARRRPRARRRGP